MNRLRIDILFCLVIGLVIQFWYPQISHSQPERKDSVSILQEVAKPLVSDTAEVIKRGELNIQQLKLEVQKSKDLSKSINKETRKRNVTTGKVISVTKDIEGRIMYKEPNLKDPIKIVTDSTYINLKEDKTTDKHAITSKPKKQLFFIKWFTKNKKK